jgi:signal recognition particle subunit SRP54
MFDTLTDKLSATLKKLSGKGRLTDENIQETLKDVRNTLIDADVALPVVQTFIETVRTNAIGKEVIKSLKPGEALVKVVSDTLIDTLGAETSDLNLRTQPPAVILMAGLQGSGKTTTSAKLANFLKTRHKKKVMLASTDIYRPAAMDQLETLAEQVKAAYFPASPTDAPVNIAKDAIADARKKFMDVLIIDTAGRLHIDDEMMNEIKQIHAAINPIETLFVVDSMTGQDAAHTAKTFHEALPLTGVVLTKTDGDARGGAALSIRQITGKPIKFMGEGEKIDALEIFHPDRVASRILGMGDILSLVEEAHRKVDQKKAQKLAKKIAQGQAFTLEDFRQQLQEMQNMGGMAGIMSKIPGMSQLPAAAQNAMGDKQFKKMEAIISSMTPNERIDTNLMNGSRKRRIAMGSGTDIQDINRLLKQFTQMQKMMKKMKGNGMMKMMNKMKNVLPKGFQG